MDCIVYGSHIESVMTEQLSLSLFTFIVDLQCCISFGYSKMIQCVIMCVCVYVCVYIYIQILFPHREIFCKNRILTVVPCGFFFFKESLSL